LKSLDSNDRSNRKCNNEMKMLPGLEQYEEFLRDSDISVSLNFH
jgi:hypothetical protein